jgi:hypothetical protein
LNPMADDAAGGRRAQVVVGIGEASQHEESLKLCDHYRGVFIEREDRLVPTIATSPSRRPVVIHVEFVQL